ncbi:ATP-binding protein [Chitinophaga barathri]|uniref:ATP-binding protein n=1 Tax=Chitinophaga barathri TaxID=1647451 RepID=A0A3N4MGF8_9BACT|nr:AAA family ATPase [Chitinophaga barathri]RPD41096.1 ATP-binding protein [Chitinophaga barathri]
MEILIEFQDRLLKSTTNDFRRYLHGQINWKQRMIAIKGPRGAGKTTLFLQYLKFDLGLPSTALYITADHTWFYNHSLLETATDWYKMGGRTLFIDEVHKYPQWSRELKNIYDGLPDMQVVFSASSALDIYRGEADLSRRVITYTLPGLSFREYLSFITGKQFDHIALADLPTRHRDFSRQILHELQPLPFFKKYLQNGYLPIIAEGEAEYLLKLEQVVNAIVDVDLSYIASFNAGTAIKIKKLLAVIAESVPFKPNIAALARKLDMSRDSVYQYIYLLKDARLLNVLSAEGSGVSTLQKPDKIYLENTNLIHTMTERPETGNIRETFLLGQLLNSGKVVYAPPAGDFQVGDMVIEAGGKNKKATQVKDTLQYMIAADDIETGIGTQVPLWLFGFLY